MASVYLFLTILAAMTADRTVGSAIQLWGMRRVGKHICRNLDKALERATMQAEDKQRKARAN
jgi:hypothetical protein